MKDKEKQIEEKTVKAIFDDIGMGCFGVACDSCEANDRGYRNKNACEEYFIALKLYRQGYRKLPKDSVVLSKKEYENLTLPKYIIKANKLTKKEMLEQLKSSTYCIVNSDTKIEIIPTRAEIEKETAEKIISIVDNVCEKYVEYAINKIKYRSAEELYCSAVKSFAESFKKELAKQFGVEIKE